MRCGAGHRRRFANHSKPGGLAYNAAVGTTVAIVHDHALGAEITLVTVEVAGVLPAEAKTNAIVAVEDERESVCVV